MAASITHLVVGERVFKQATHLIPTAAVYGCFLTGCVLVDVHVFHDIDRRKTHFVGRFEEGKDAYSKSCSNFLDQLDTLLNHPWNDMTRAEQAFVMGYLCHLAADECWKELGCHVFEKLGITSWVDLPVPFDVLLTAFDFLSRRVLIDPATAFTALQNSPIPDVFRHVPHETWLHQWNLIQEYVGSDGTPWAYIKMLERAGEPSDKIQEAKRQHDIYWEDAIKIFNSIGGVFPFIQSATARTIDVMLQSWINPTGNNAADASPSA